MKNRGISTYYGLFLIILALFYSNSWAMELDTSKYIPIDEIRADMEGYCLMVFSGMEVERFPLKVLSIARHQKVGQDMIVVLVMDERFQHAGTIHGCSGSPVYIDGRLAGALAAGTSYQAFSYHIKCAGRAVCSWTSWWEIAYLLLSAASVNAMVVAGAYHGLDGKLRRAGIGYAAGNQVVYTVLVLVGAWLLDRFLISFEFLLLAAAPSVIALFFLNLWRYRRYRDPADGHLIKTWLGLGAGLAGYFIYLVLGITDSLWEQGFWFSENDLLHIGLIGWMLFIVVRVVHRLHDLENPPLYTP